MSFVHHFEIRFAENQFLNRTVNEDITTEATIPDPDSGPGHLEIFDIGIFFDSAPLSLTLTWKQTHIL